MFSMKMLGRCIACVFVLALTATEALEAATAAHHHHHHKGKHHHHKGKHHKHHGKHHTTPEEKVAKAKEIIKAASAPSKQADKAVAKPVVAQETVAAKPVNMAIAGVKVSKDEQLVEKMKALELRLSAEKKKRAEAPALEKGHILVSGPLPVDFSQRFSQAAAAATGVDAKLVTVTKTAPVGDQQDVVSVDFKAPKKVVKEIEAQSGDSDSKLANGNMHSFLVAKGDEDDEEPKKEKEEDHEEHEEAEPKRASEATPVEQKGIDIDTAMPYGDLEPFGREDTAQELTEDSVKESDSMVDQLERAEVAEEKRAVFRALTRLRGAAITSFDGVARSQTGNIDEYNKIHKWRSSHPLHHLADEESDISKWAFPDNAD